MRLVIERGRTALLSDLPPKSIALDGYCLGPEIDTEQQRYSFDHHSYCVRLATSATCRQVYDALQLGLDPSDFTIFVNDIDPDTVLSVWLLMNPAAVSSSDVYRLVEVASTVDAHGPAYPVRDRRTADLWEAAMRPLMGMSKASYASADLEALMASALLAVGQIIAAPATFERPLASYELRHGTGWTMAVGAGHLLRYLYEDGYVRVVTIEQLDDGSYAVTVAKKSELVPWPVGPGDRKGTILHHLSAIEPGWGGSSTIGGAPRNPDGSRSKLTPDQIFNEIESNFAVG